MSGIIELIAFNIHYCYRKWVVGKYIIVQKRLEMVERGAGEGEAGPGAGEGEAGPGAGAEREWGL